MQRTLLLAFVCLGCLGLTGPLLAQESIPMPKPDQEAVRAAETAMQGAATAGLNEIVTHNEALLKLYRSNKPYHDSAPSPPRAPVKN